MMYITRKRQFSRMFVALVLMAIALAAVDAFTMPASVSASARSTSCIKSKTCLKDNSGSNGNEEAGIFDRFLNPVLDDPWLPLNEAGVAQVVAPTLQLFWIAASKSPLPSWAQPLYDTTFVMPRGSFLAPTLVHGAALATCWLVGCIAAEAFKKEAYEGTYAQVLTSTIKAGAFACGLLVLGTQFDLYGEIGFAQPGDSPETDVRIYRALVEVINDIVFEATTLISYRLLRCSLSKM